MREALYWGGVGGLGGLGALGRFLVATAVAKRHQGAFPLGTLAVNLTGTFALGVLVGAPVGDHVLHVLGVGLLGGYTTFSTWMVETDYLAEHNRGGLAVLNVAASTLAGLGAAAAGWALGATLF